MVDSFVRLIDARKVMAESAHERARIAQNAYWDALSDLEAELDIELDGEDLNDWAVDELLAARCSDS